jgi:hypothetical protein
MNQILTQIERCCLFGWVSAKISKLKLKQVLSIYLITSRTVEVFVSCRTAVLRLVIFTLTLAQKFEISNLKINKFGFFHAKNYLHEMAEQEDMKRKRIVNGQREAGYC